MKKKLGFTLAEVLITLGVIGIVAAITIPGLIGKFNRIVTENRLRAFYSTISQGFRMYKAENGDLPLPARIPDSQAGDAVERNQEIFDTYFAPVFKGVTSYSRNETVTYNGKIYSYDGAVRLPPAGHIAAYYSLADGTVFL